MTRIRLASLALLAVLTVEASAQFLPPPVVGLPITIPNGIDFRYKSGRLRVNGFIPTGGSTSLVLPVIPGGAPPGVIVPATYYPYVPFGPYYAPNSPFPLMGVVEQRTTLQILNPPGIPLRAGFVPFPDVSGIDLDAEPASKIWGNKPAIAKVEPAPKVEIAAKAAKVAAPPKLPGEQFLNLGVTAFKNGEYGLALKWFRESAKSNPVPPRATFYVCQTYIAVGKYREAAKALERGLDNDPRWPAEAFRPRADLYDNDNIEFNDHRDQLAQAQRAEPKNADYLFLLGYLAWFDGQRDVAVVHFQQARALAVDATAIDLFLRMVKKK